MNRFYSHLIACLVVLSTLSIAWRATAKEPAPQVDAKTQQVLHKAADFLQQQKSFSLTLQSDVNIQAAAIKQAMTNKYSLVVAHPNRVALRTLEEDNGVTVVSDGKQFSRAIGIFKRYVVSEAPASVTDAFTDPAVAMIALGTGGTFLRTLFSENVYGDLIEGVTLVCDEGSDKVDGHDCQHIHFEQPEYDWDLWIDSGKEPLVRKITLDPTKKLAAQQNEQLKNMKMSVALLFDKWDFQPKLTDEQFTFTPPAGFEKVESLLGGGGEAEEGPHPLLGKVAPAFTLEQASGGNATLKQHRDKDVVILDFWATWCGPCRQALPIISKVAKKYRDKGVVFYAVDLQEEPGDVRKFLEDEKLEIPAIFDRDGEVAKLYGVEGIPQTVLVGKDGTVQVVHVGLSGDLETRLSKELDDLLAGKDLATAELDAAKNKKKDKKE